MTFRHLATVVEMVDWSPQVGLDVAGVVGVDAAVVKGCKGLEELMDEAVGGWPIKGKTALLGGGVKGGCTGEYRGGVPGGGPGGDCAGRRGGGPGGGPGGSPTGSPNLWGG